VAALSVWHFDVYYFAFIVVVVAAAFALPLFLLPLRANSLRIAN